MLSERTRPIFLGGDEGGAMLSEVVDGSTTTFNDLTLFDRGRNEKLPGEGRGVLPVFARARDALIGVSNEVGRALFGLGRVDGLDSICSSSFIAARAAETSPNVDFLRFAGALFSARFDSANELVNGFCGLDSVCGRAKA